MSDEARDEPAVRPVDPEFHEYRRTHDRGLRNRLIERHLAIAYDLAHRYRHRGVADEDLEQVAMMGLLKAVERFEPDRGLAFSTFATPTILGELRRYFRDSTWSVRVPRRLQERARAVNAAIGPLAQRLARSPRPNELAAETGLTEEEVLEALDADSAYGTAPLEAPTEKGERPETPTWLADRPEERPDHLVERHMLAASLLDTLSDQERRVVELRFEHELTQLQIAARVGVSQMQVSRLLARALAKMRSRAEQQGGS